MKGINDREGELFIDEVSLNDVVAQYGTPIYVYSASQLKKNLNRYLSSIRTEDKLCFSVKSNSNTHILSALNKQGASFDVVSGNELKRCLEAGAKAEQIVFSGVGKSEEELIFAIKQNIFSINVESEEELDRIISISKKLERKANCMLRVNPDLSSTSHPYIQTGLKSSKFGILIEALDSVAQKALESNSINIKGLASHVGSQVFDKKLIFENLDLLIDLTNHLSLKNHQFSFIDIGGGFGLSYKDEEELNIEGIITEITSKLDSLNLNLILEPGRSISGNSGLLLSKVEYLKKTSDMNFAILDSGMNDLIRPALYKSWHNISVITSNGEEALEYKVVGPVCESGDTFGENRTLSLSDDSIVAIHDAGAYGHVMSSNYNSRLKLPEVLVEGTEVILIRRRETFDDLMKQERDV
tara:strand:+ start:527 stop:1765 length:1239 start_codon:yes stop_codon:yes gene_type:complete